MTLTQFVGKERNLQRMLEILKTSSHSWFYLQSIGIICVALMCAWIPFISVEGEYFQSWREWSAWQIIAAVGLQVLWILLLATVLRRLPQGYIHELTVLQERMDTYKKAITLSSERIQSIHDDHHVHFVLFPLIVEQSDRMIHTLKMHLKHVHELETFPDDKPWRKHIAQTLMYIDTQENNHHNHTNIFYHWCKDYFFVRRNADMLIALTVVLRNEPRIDSHVIGLADDVLKKFTFFEKGLASDEMSWSHRLSHTWEEFSQEIDEVIEIMSNECRKLFTEWRYA